MKYFFSSIFVSLCLLQIHAQKNPGSVHISGNPIGPIQKALYDTVYNGFENYNPVIYSVPDDTGGYVTGSNGYGDKAKAQQFSPGASSYLTGAIFWFGKKVKTTGGDTSSIVLKYYRRDSVQLVAGSYVFVPGTLVISDTILLNNVPVDTQLSNAMLVWNFPNPELIASSFYLGFDMGLMHPSDSIALYGSSNGETQAKDMSWELWLDKWNTIENAWGLDIDLAIFPIFDIENASLENSGDVAIQLYPNPATHEISVQSKSPLLSIEIMDMNGKILSTQKQVNRVSISFLKAGTYLIKAETEDGSIRFGRFVKAD